MYEQQVCADHDCSSGCDNGFQVNYRFLTKYKNCLSIVLTSPNGHLPKSLYISFLLMNDTIRSNKKHATSKE